mmetsp:Transcript_37768/g.100305  ORF Transcript_37768/g.100305 Transcript_37768/m.100305 type:complete len:255 (+) Transcript_37768:194-958(+)
MGTRTTVLGTRCEDGLDSSDVLQVAQLRHPPALLPSLPTDAASFLRNCLLPFPAARARAHRLVQHPFLVGAPAASPPLAAAAARKHPPRAGHRLERTCFSDSSLSPPDKTSRNKAGSFRKSVPSHFGSDASGNSEDGVRVDRGCASEGEPDDSEEGLSRPSSIGQAACSRVRSRDEWQQDGGKLVVGGNGPVALEGAPRRTRSNSTLVDPEGEIDRLPAGDVNKHKHASCLQHEFDIYRSAGWPSWAFKYHQST